MALMAGGLVLVALAALVTWRPELPDRLPPWLVTVAAAGAAIAFALGDTAPTGWVVLDVVARAAFGAAVVLAAARLRLGWTLWLAAASAALMVVADAGAWEAVGAAGVAVALVLVVAIGANPTVQAVAAAAAIAPMAHLRWPLAAGASALAVAVVCVPVLVAALPGAPTSVRRGVTWGALAAGGLVIIGATVGLVAAIVAQPDVDRAVDAAVTGLDQVSEKDTAPAREHLREAEAAFDDASSTMRSWWARPALLVPVVAQQSRAVATMADAGAELADVAATSLEAVDFERLQPSDGQVDLAAVDDVTPPIQAAAAVLRRSDQRLSDVESPLLVPMVADRLDRLLGEVSNARGQAETAAEAIDVAPDLLGADGPRRYFLIMQTPSELRGVGGFMGSWGELVIDDGEFDLVRTGRLRELIDGGAGAGNRHIDDHAEFLAHWGDNDPSEAWGRAAFSPDFPTVGSLIAQLYPQSGGEEIDGVISLDPSAFASLLELTGPITVEGSSKRLEPETAEEYLLQGQYIDFASQDRGEFLRAATEALFDELTAGDLPSPRVIGRELGPAVAGRHLQLYSLEDAEERFFTRIGADGEAHRTGSADAIGIIGQSYNGNKIDYFLRRRLTYDVTWDPASGEVVGSVEVGVRNRAPTSGLPHSIIGWGGDVSAGQLPVADGENLHLLSLYSAMDIDDLTLDGSPASLQWNDLDLGYQARDLFVRVPSGAESVVKGQVRGVIEPGERYDLELLRQSTATPDEVEVRIRLADGWELADGRTTFEWKGDTTAPVHLGIDAQRASPGLLDRLKGA